MRNVDPIAFFFTWVTFGTWLPGDARGWVDYRRGWQLPSRVLEADCNTRMMEDAVRLTAQQRKSDESQVEETARQRGWHLYAVNCRSNHVHAVVSAGQASPKKIRTDLKAYATRVLRQFDPSRTQWWAERGSIRWVFTEDELSTVVDYVKDGQDRKPEA